MCNLNIFIRAKEQDKKKGLKLLNFLNCATALSYCYNRDGDGVYFSCNNKIVKSADKLNLLEYSKSIKESNFIISHQRLATHGLESKYIQPFKDSGFIFIHNGILSDYTNGKGSDSFNFFKQFIKVFKGSNGSQEEKIILSLKFLLNDTRGSYSIFLYDTENKTGYYVKNSTTLINFYRNVDKNELYITTKKDNIDFLNIYDGFFKPLNIGEDIIYKVFLKDEKVKILEVGKIKRKKYAFNGHKMYKSYYWDGYKFNQDIYSNPKEENYLSKKKREFNIFMSPNKQICANCKLINFNSLGKLGYNLCDECLKDEFKQLEKEEQDFYKKRDDFINYSYC